MTEELRGRRVAILATDGVEQVEYEQPRQAVEQAGAEVTLLSIRTGEIQSMHADIDKGDRFTVDRLVSEVSPDDFDALILPGGTVNPDGLRANPDAVGFVREFVRSGKPVGSICHGPWTLVEADVVRGRRLTSFPSLATDLRNAGADVVDQDVVIDKNLITSRSPEDLSAFSEAIVSQLAGTTTKEEEKS